MKYFLKTILLCGLCVFLLCSCCEILSAILGLTGGITITSPEDGIIVATSSITVEGEADHDYVDYITLEVNGTVVYTTSVSTFSEIVSLEPSNDIDDPNIITAELYAYESDTATESYYAGSDTIYVFYDNQDPVLTITDPVNWSVIPIDPPANIPISGTVIDNFGIETLSYLDNGTYNTIAPDGDGNWDLTLSDLSYTTHSYLFLAEDLAGRTVVNVVTFTVVLP